MIYTLTLNPALDYVISVDNFTEGTINRTKHEHIFAGGKGINVSTVLNNLGMQNVALGLIAGSTGDMLDNILKSEGYATDFINVDQGMTRINVKLHSYSGISDSKNGSTETEINGQGPDVSDEEVGRLFARLKQLTAGDVLIMSGSIPKCMSDTIYQDICELLYSKKVLLVIDAVKDILVKCLKYNPLLVKPNHKELGEIFGVDIESFDDAIKYASKLKNQGARNVMVSMASKGAVLIDEYGNTYKAVAPKGSVVNSVCAGDTAVGAFVHEYICQVEQNEGKIDYKKILQYAVCAGSATAFTEGIASKLEIEALIPFCKTS